MKTTKAHFKKLIAVVLAVLMVFSSLVFTTVAEDPSEHVHSYEVKSFTDATCLENGVKISECTGCDESTEGHFLEETIPAKNHNFVKSETVAPTCSQQGYDIEICSRCQLANKTNVVAPLGHKYAETPVDPTCDTEGGIIYTCTVCDENEPLHTKFVANADKLGHELGEYKIVPYGDAYAKQAACTRDDCSYTEYEMDGDGEVVIYYRVQFFNNRVTNATEYAADGSTVAVAPYSSVLLQDSFVPAGSACEYTEKTPTRDVTYDFGAYEFTGWAADDNDKGTTPDAIDLENVTQNIIAVAQFEGQEVTHWVMFYNPDAKPLTQMQYVKHGQAATKPLSTPEYEPYGYYHYEFKGWNKDTSAVYSNCAVTADYKQIGKTYKIIYCDTNGSQLASEVFQYGSAPTQNPTTIDKPDDETYYYSFSGKWTYSYEAPSEENKTTAIVTEDYDITRLLAPNNAIDLATNTKYADHEYDPKFDIDNDENKYLSDIEKGIIRVYADYYTRAKIYRVRIAVVDSDGDPIYNNGTITVTGSKGYMVKTAVLDETSSVVLELPYDQFYTILVSYSGEGAQQIITLDERNLGDFYPTVRIILSSPREFQEDKADNCTCISHVPVIGRIYIAFLNVIYRLTGRKIVCCFDMYEKHADQLVYTA